LNTRLLSLEVHQLNIQIMAKRGKDLTVDSNIPFACHSLRNLRLIAQIRNSLMHVHVIIELVQLSNLLLNRRVVQIFSDPMINDFSGEARIVFYNLLKLIIFLRLNLSS
jgi:hypothetical protein